MAFLSLTLNFPSKISFGSSTSQTAAATCSLISSLQVCQGKEREEDLGEAEQVVQLQGHPRISHGRPIDSPLPLTSKPPANRETDNSAMMELLLDLSSQILAMEEYMAQQSKQTETKIGGMRL